MTTTKKIGYGIGGFGLSVLTAVIAAAGLQVLIAYVWTPPPSFLVAYGSAFAIAIVAIASSWVFLLQALKNKAMIRGVWCYIYTIVAIAAVSLIISLI
ncbi:MAG: hypothetical protein ACI88G_000779 [Woeseiaceae bacterium]|jgi:hypothetical protein